jgi:hypothetical protein
MEQGGAVENLDTASSVTIAEMPSLKAYIPAISLIKSDRFGHS